MAKVEELAKDFVLFDADRRAGKVGPDASIQDRMKEGALIAGLMGPLAPLATVPVGLAGLGYEGVKGLGQATGLGKYLPGPFKADETTSPASLDNVIALMKGFTEEATPGYQKGGKVPDFMELIQLLLNPPQGQTQFQSGGMVPNATFRMPTADLMKMAQGGAVKPFVPGAASPSYGAPGGGIIPGVADQLQSYNPDVGGSSASAGRVGEAADKLGGFTPFGGAGGSTLNEMLLTGRPTDVAPITEAAKSEGEQFFNEQLGGINEQMGAFGLSSSTARTGAIADALSKIGTNIGNEGLRAGVGAQESAANRSAGALNPFFTGTGQQLGAQTAGLQGLLGAGNLQLGGEQARIQGQLGAMGNLTNLGLGLAPIQNQQINQVPQGLPRTVTSPVNSPWAGIGSNRGFVSAASAANPYKVGGGISAVGGGRGGSRLGGYARGGSVTPDRYVANQGSGRTDFGDYMSQLLYGQKFNRMVPEEIPEIQLPRVQAPQFIQPQVSAMPNIPGGGLSRVQEDSPADYAVKMMKWAANMKPWNTSGMPMDPFTGQGFRGGMADQAMREALTILQGRGSGGGGPASQMPGRPPNTAEMMKLVNLAAGAPAQQGSQAKQEGGYIDGPSVPPDQVPILAQGGEGVIPVKMMAELQKSKSSDPLIQKLQDLMGFACGGKVGKYEKGGKVKKMQKGGLASKARPGSPASSEPYTSSVTYDPTAAAGYEDPVNAALRRLSLIQSAMTLDPQGGGIQQSGPGMIAQQQQVLEPLLQARQQEEQRATAEAQAEAQRQHEAMLAEQEAEVQKAQIEATTNAQIAREQMWQAKEGDPFDAALASVSDMSKARGANRGGSPNMPYSQVLELLLARLAPYQDDPRYIELQKIYEGVKAAEGQQPGPSVTDNVEKYSGMLDEQVPPGVDPQQFVNAFLGAQKGIN